MNGRACVFCGESAGSREHALPRWLAGILGLGKAPTTPRFFSEANGWESQGNARRIDDLITKRVCAACNNGWMNGVENEVISILFGLVKPDICHFDRQSLQSLRWHEPLLRRWLTKTAITLSHLISRAGVDQVPAHLAQETKENKLPDSALIYAGWMPSPNFTVTINPGFPAFLSGKFHSNLVRKDGLHLFHFGIQLNYLALRIINAPGGGLVLLESSDSGPSYSPSFITPRAFGAEHDDSPVFPDFLKFMKACVVTLGDTMPSHRDVRDAAESLQKPGIIP